MANAATILGGLTLALASLLSGHVRHWDFEKDAVGETPAGFSVEQTAEAPACRWEVVDDDGNHVLGQLDESPARRRYALAILEEPTFKDLKLSVRVKAIRGEREQSGGLVWRYKNPENYLVARLDVTEQNVKLFRFFNGNRVEMGVEGDLDLSKDQWYTLRVEHCRSKIKVYLDEDILFITHDKHFHDPGQIGLWTKSYSVMYFDDLKAKHLGHDDD